MDLIKVFINLENDSKVWIKLFAIKLMIKLIVLFVANDLTLNKTFDSFLTHFKTCLQF